MKGHRKTVKKMNQPATGWYADCSCGEQRGALRKTKEQAEKDFRRHLAGVAK